MVDSNNSDPQHEQDHSSSQGDTHGHHRHHCCRKRSKVARFFGWSFLLIIVFAIGMAVSFCFRSADGHLHWITQEIQEEYELNDAQTAELVDMGDVLLKAKDQLQSQRTVRIEQLADNFAAETLDTEKTLAVWQEINAEVNQSLQQLVTEAAQFHNLLSPEQRAEIAEQIRELKYRH